MKRVQMPAPSSFRASHQWVLFCSCERYRMPLVCYNALRTEGQEAQGPLGRQPIRS